MQPKEFIQERRQEEKLKDREMMSQLETKNKQVKQDQDKYKFEQQK